MKKLWGLFIAAVMLAALCACGSQSNAGSRTPASPAPVGTAEAGAAVIAAGETAPPEAAAPAEDEQAGPEPEAKTDTLSAARGLIGEDVALLYAAIGKPNSSDYAPSCLVDGEDGELYYDEFVVYTQRTANGETVYYVE